MGLELKVSFLGVFALGGTDDLIRSIDWLDYYWCDLVDRINELWRYCARPGWRLRDL